jgi:hypothetical protein
VVVVDVDAFFDELPQAVSTTDTAANPSTTACQRRTLRTSWSLVADEPRGRRIGQSVVVQRSVMVAGAGLALVLAMAVTPVAARAVQPKLPTGPGCAGRTAVAHYAAGTLVEPPPAGAPVPCGVSTGFAGAESHIVATADAVVFTPAVRPSGTLGTGSAPVPVGERTQSNADPAGLAVSPDRGATWTFVEPGGLTWNPTDHSDFVDPVTNRMFFEDYGPIPLAPALGPEQEGPAHIMWTDNPRQSQGWHHTAIPTVFLPENPRFTAAPPPAHQAAAVKGYPNVIYFCANANVGFVSPVISGRVCFKSLDGGDSFTQTGVLFTGAVPQHAECGSNGEIYSAIDGYYPQPAPDGSLYVMVACGGTTYLARSTDEAASFPIAHAADGQPLVLPVPPASTGAIGSPDLRIDPAGTMFLMWTMVKGGMTKIVLSLSSDEGRKWTSPLDVTAPGVAVDQWAMAESGGNVAAAYLGRKQDQPTLDAYLTETRNARDVLAGGRPVFWSARLNTQPILYGNSVQGSGYLTLPAGLRAPFPPPFGNQMFGNDFIGATIAPDGSAWGAFDQDCGPSPDAAGCVAQDDQTRGFAGRLLWPAASSSPTQASPPAAASRPRGVRGRQLPATGGSGPWPMLGLVACGIALGGLGLSCRAKGIRRAYRSTKGPRGRAG